MKELIGRISALTLAAACFVIAFFFKTAVPGYTMTAIVFFAAGLIILAFYALGILAKKREKKAKTLRGILIAVLAAGLMYFAVVESIVVKNSVSDEGGADYVIVLGAGVNGTVPSLSLRDRLEAALEYLSANPDTVAVVSGGQGQYEDITEAECMFLWLTDRGIAPERIIREERALSTSQSISFSLELIAADSQKASPAIAVLTAEYHLYRAEEIARREGVSNPLGIAAGTSIPLLRTNYFIREAFAVTAMWLGYQ